MKLFASDCIDLTFSRVDQKNSSSRSLRRSLPAAAGGEKSLLQSPQPFLRPVGDEKNRAGARKLVLLFAVEAPHLRQKAIWQFALKL
jgi:hypothetical protein